jgi:nucleotide-binding universal stress UspA family protein
MRHLFRPEFDKRLPESLNCQRYYRVMRIYSDAVRKTGTRWNLGRVTHEIDQPQTLQPWGMLMFQHSTKEQDMYSKIMVPVDLRNAEPAGKALATAADLAKLYGAEVHIVGVTSSAPTEVAHTPEEFAGKLNAFAAEQSKSLGVTLAAHTEIGHDITIDLDTVLSQAAKSLGADLIVMASHVPGLAEYVFSSNAGYLASHSSLSVFVVR